MIVWLWLDHSKFGCGWRQYVAIVGRKWVHLTLIASGEHARISIGEYNDATRRPAPMQPTTPRKAKRHLIDASKVFGKYDNRAVKDALRSI